MDYLQYWYYDIHQHNNSNVLNLVVSGIPSIPEKNKIDEYTVANVLNLVISGIPSIHGQEVG